jgi:hypothetical protein
MLEFFCHWQSNSTLNIHIMSTVDDSEESGAGIVSIGTYEGNLIGWEAKHSSISNKQESAASDSDSDSDSSDVEGEVGSRVLRASGGPLELVYAFRAHETAIRAVAIDDSGKLLVTAAADETARWVRVVMQ